MRLRNKLILLAFALSFIGVITFGQHFNLINPESLEEGSASVKMHTGDNTYMPPPEEQQPNLYVNDFYTINGDTVYAQNQHGLIAVTPHTLHSPDGCYEVEATSYLSSQDIDCAVSSRSGKSKIRSVGYWQNISHDVTEFYYDNVTLSYTCPYSNFSYRLTPDKYAWCYSSNGSLVFNHSFLSGNLPSRTIYWNETHSLTRIRQQFYYDWKDVSAQFSQQTYQGKDYFTINNIPWQMNDVKKVKFCFNNKLEPIPTGGWGIDEKLDVACKRSIETWQSALSNDNLFIVDPWQNASCQRKRNITMDKPSSNFPLFNILLNGTNGIDMNAYPCNTMAFYHENGTKLDYECEKFNGTGLVWVEVPAVSSTTNTTIEWYYNCTNQGNPNPALAWDYWNVVMHFENTSFIESTRNNISLAVGNTITGGVFGDGALGATGQISYISLGSYRPFGAGTDYGFCSLWTKVGSGSYQPWGVEDVSGAKAEGDMSYRHSPPGNIIWMANSVESSVNFATTTPSADYALMSWQWNNGVVSTWVNGTAGASNGSYTGSSAGGRNLAWEVGSSELTGWGDGYTDEVRCSNKANNKIKNEYIEWMYNQRYQLLYTLGSEETNADITLPVSILISPLNDTYSTSSTTSFICNATDETALSNITLYLNSIANQTNTASGTEYNINFTVGGLADNKYIWNCLAKDSNNNAAFNTSYNRTFYVDTTAPNTITLNAPGNNSNQSYQSAILFNVTALDNVDTNLTCNITIDSGINATLGVSGSSKTISLSGFTNASHSWNATCYDGANNSNSSLTYFFNVNTPPDTPSIITPPNNSYQNDTSIQLNCSGTDANSEPLTYEYYGAVSSATYGSIGNSSGQIQWNTTNGNGTYLWHCRSWDGLDYGSWIGNRTLFMDTAVLGGIEENHTNFSSAGTAITFTFNSSYNNITISGIDAMITYNGENKTVYEISVSGNKTAFNATFQPPLTTVQQTVKFNWTVYATYINGTRKQETFSYNHLVNPVSIFNCSSGNDTTIRVLNISYKTEVNDLENVSGNFEGTFFVWTTDKNTNITLTKSINDTKQFYICITPNGTYQTDAQFQYNSPGYDFRDYYLVNQTLINNSQKIDLYLLEIALGTGITFKVQDESTLPFQGYYIVADRYDIGNDTYKTVAMAKTNELGTDLMFLRENDVFYRFRVYDYTDLKYTSVKQKLINTDHTFTITISPGSFADILDRFEDVSYTLTYNNNTNTFQLSYSSAAGTLTGGCLAVIRKSLVNESVICDQCSAAASATLTCTIDPNITGTYVAAFYEKINPNLLIKTLEKVIEINNLLKGKLKGEGTFLAFLLMTAMVMTALWSPAVAIIMAIFSLIILGFLGILTIGYGTILFFIIIGAVVVVKLK